MLHYLGPNGETADGRGRGKRQIGCGFRLWTQDIMLEHNMTGGDMIVMMDVMSFMSK